MSVAAERPTVGSLASDRFQQERNLTSLLLKPPGVVRRHRSQSTRGRVVLS